MKSEEKTEGRQEKRRERRRDRKNVTDSWEDKQYMNMYVCMHSYIVCVSSSSFLQQWLRGEAGCHGDHLTKLLNIHMCSSHLLHAGYFLLEWKSMSNNRISESVICKLQINAHYISSHPHQINGRTLH